jgi:predicted dienelactone hydrolase
MAEIAIEDDQDRDRGRAAAGGASSRSGPSTSQVASMRFVPILLAGALALWPTLAGAAGFRFATVPDPDDRPLEVGIWYPTDAPAPAAPNTPFRHALALDAPVVGENLPLVVISHGYGGWLGGHAGMALALAEAGFVVVAPTHTGNNYEDESYPTARWMVDRPRHIARVLDYILGQWPDRARLDPKKIGFFGFSAGGYTGLVAIGGVPNLRLAAEHCRREPAEVACGLGVAEGADSSAVEDRGRWVHEPRIRSAVLAAAGFGFAFDREALKDVSAPVQLWAAAADRHVPGATNTRPVLEGLPVPPDYREVADAGHFVFFLPPCSNPKFQAAEPNVWAMVCVDPPGFDRLAFHRAFNAEAVRFFRESLKVPAAR